MHHLDNTGSTEVCHKSEFGALLPVGVTVYDTMGVGLPLQLTFMVEQYIKSSYEKGWFHAPQASQLQAQLNLLVTAFGRMETIRLTPIPVAHL